MPSKQVPWAAGPPIANNGEAMQEFPDPKTAFARYGATTQASSVITLTDNTTVVDIAVSGGTGVALKWIATSDTAGSVIGTGATSNFDHVVPPNWRQRLVVPIESMGVGSGSVVGVGPQKGLYKRLAYINVGAPASSIFVAEH